MKDADWDYVIAVNLAAPLVLSRALAGPMKERGWGRIIHISSVFGLVSRAGRNAYSATKAGLIGLTRSMSLELASFGVTVNAILPGPFETPLTAALHPDPERKQWFTDRVPMGRWGRPDELAGPCSCWLPMRGATSPEPPWRSTAGGWRSDGRAISAGSATMVL